MRWLGDIMDSMDRSVSTFQRTVKNREALVCCKSMGTQKVRDILVTEQIAHI